ncbi:glycosyltransferase family 4 protein [Terrilactibacillus laevilacticus]|uniref:Glycosyltransferase family 4 protein n=1 Tax=Terrilactibacillus laevilacticus TaxID=1380157 RepID=A0ABW5PNF3_9BACI|nr:glycosyltransferase family 1 protein [Terrilactibacillus laevilacticus]
MGLKFYINGRFLTQSITGVQRFAREIILELDKYLNNTDLNIEVLVPHKNNINIRYNNIKIIKCGKLGGHLWEQIELPRYSKDGLLLNLCNTGPIFKRKQFIVIHDAAVYTNPETYSKAFVFIYRMIYKIITKFSLKIFTVSDFSRKEISKYCNISSENIKIISEGKEHILRIESSRSIIDSYDLVTNQYVLAVSSLNPNKNFESILKAIELLSESQIKVVIAGGKNNKVFKELGYSFDENTVIQVGYVSDSELKALYENALCFVFPSFYEGFGLPPLEAMACECPVIVSKTSSLPEVCGEAALYINPRKPTEIAQQIRKILSDHNLRKNLSRNSIKQSEKFTWEKGLKTIINEINNMVMEQK